MSDILRVGIIGTGGIARAHMQAIRELDEVSVAALFDVSAERSLAVAEEFGGRACASLEELLEADDVDAVHVCTPHHLHADQVLAAAAAGKHVLVEKPMALTLADCDRMVRACEAAGRILMVGQVLRYRPVNRKARQLIAEGAIGSVGHQVRRRYGRFDPGVGHWYLDLARGGNCVLYCFGPHEYDLLHWLVSSPVVRLYAQGTQSSERFAGQCDSYSALMTHANGAVSVLTQTVVSHAGAWDQHVVGSTGSLFLTASEVQVNGETVPVEGSPADGMRQQIAEFARCCLHGGTPDASGDSVRHTMAVIEAVQLSAGRGEPIELAELDECSCPRQGPGGRLRGWRTNPLCRK